METITPSAQFFLDHVFAQALVGLGATAAARTRRVQQHIRAFVDSHGSAVMCAHQLTEHELEKELDTVGAAARVLAPVDLFVLLERYAEPTNLLPDRLDASRQVQVLSDLTARLIRGYDWGDIACEALELRSAITRMRAAQRRR
ncbi:hypothetical protein HQQ80_05145 [Microbacteriaceae bacterium VKM Ac-2855]|nr:hypothetical protein [Microbacteriaceae bacterium VKM Ac-2855]